MKQGKKTRWIAKLLAALFAVGLVAGVAVGCKKDTPNSETDLEIALWEAGNGREFMDQIVAAFEEEHPEITVYLSANASTQTEDLASGGDINSIDLYFSTLEAYLGYKQYLEPLDDILKGTVDGVSIGSKLDGRIIEQFRDPEDETLYVLPWSTSVNGIVYNKTVFDERWDELPRTTNELKAIVEDAISQKDADSTQPSPFLHYAEYWLYLLYAWQAQYDGIDAFYDAWQFTYEGETNRVESITGGAATKEQLKTEHDSGRYKSLEALYELISPQGAVYNGSNSFDHTTSQTIFLDGQALMMPNGSWVENEMKQYVTDDMQISLMKTPVLSSLAPKLGISENQLSVIVAECDGVELSPKDQNLLASTKENNPDAVADVPSIRNVAFTEQSQFHAFIPNYAVAKDAAKEFLKFFYSDAALKIYYDTTHMPQPAKMTTGLPDTTGWSEFTKTCLALHEEMVPVFKFLTNPIFYKGGEKNMYHYVPSRFFSATGDSDRKNLDEFWEYEGGYWLDNWDNLLDLAGLKEQ